MAPSSSSRHHRIRPRPLFWFSRVSRSCIGCCYRRHVFRGLAHTKPAVVKRTLSLKVGEPFTCEKWQRDHAALIDLDLFASIEARFGNAERPNTLELSSPSLLNRFFSPLSSHPISTDSCWEGGGSFLNLFGMDIRADAYGRTSVDPV